MKINDIIKLTAIAAIAELGGDEQQEPEALDTTNIKNRPEPETVTAPCDAHSDDVEPNNDDENDEVMVPPLQQKHELLKKATGVENNTDCFAAEIPAEDDGETNPEELKKLAGIKSANDMPILSIAHDFEPVDD